MCPARAAGCRVQRREVVHVLLARDILAVALVGDSTRPRRHRSVERGIVPQRADRLEPRSSSFAPAARRGIGPSSIRESAAPSAAAVREVAADHVGQRAAIADERRDAVDHRLGGDAAERLFPDRRDEQDARQREVVGRRGTGGAAMICGYWLKSMPGMVFSAPPLWPDCTTSTGMSGRRDPSMSARRAKSSSPLCGGGIDERDEGARLVRRDDRGPVDRRLERRADKPILSR